MTVRTISQLPAITSRDEINNDCLFEMSKPIEDLRHTSKKLQYGILNNKIQEDSKSFLSATYGITEGMDFKILEKKINDIYSSDVVLSGEVEFKKTPVVGDTKEPLATEEFVKNAVKQDNASVITPSSKKLFTIDGDMLIFDNDTSYTHSKIVKINPNITGNLILWGWMADNGTDIHPSKAWVALKMMKSLTDTSEGTILQVNPWILGTFRNQLQYVSFNIPISSGSEGMFIRIDSGFDVNEENSGSQTSDKSLADSTPNKFRGYVLGRGE